MGLETKSFTVYGYKIEVHAGGRRVWPPSFKRFVNQRLETGQLTLADVMKDCNVSQSLVYKWRADVRRAGGSNEVEPAERLFTEVILDTEETPHIEATPKSIHLHGREVELVLPACYPVEDLIRVAMALEGHEGSPLPAILNSISHPNRWIFAKEWMVLQPLW